MIKIQCYQCETCKQYLPIDAAHYLIISNLKLERGMLKKSWEPSSYKVSLEIDLANDTKKIFCSTECFSKYVKIVLKEEVE